MSGERPARRGSRRGALALGLALGLAPATAAAFEVNLSGPNLPTSKVALRSAFSVVPASGYVPFQLELENADDRTHRYRVSMSGRSSYGDNGAREHTQSFEVPPGRTRTFELLAPLPPGRPRGAGWSNVQLTVRGGPTGTRSANRSGRVPTPGEGHRPCVGFGAALPEPDVQLKGAVKGELHFVVVDVSLLPSDWRGLMGLDGLWLTLAEAREVPQEARPALASWVAQGGDLVLVMEPSLAPPAELPFDAAAWSAGRFGLGRLRRLHVAADTEAALRVGLSSLDARAIAEEHPARTEHLLQPGEVQRAIPPLEVRRGRILGFLGALALLIGPFNLFVIAPRRRRTRLLWSTPLLSVGASLLLIGAILAEDGFGGHGERAQVILQMPSITLEHRMQVQASRTGLVPFTGFEIPESWHLEALAQEGLDGQDLETGAGFARGDWFQTRSVQGQLLQEAAPSRARVVRVPSAPGEVRLTSSLPYGLDELLYLDERGHAYRGGPLAPGQTLALAPASPEDVQVALQAATARLPGHLSRRIEAALPRAGWLVGRADSGASPAPTLGSVRWQDAPTTLLAQVPARAEAARDD